MNEPIIPDRLRNKKQRRKSGAGKQLSLVLFTLIVIALVAYGAYTLFIPKQEVFELNFYTYAEVEIRDFLETLTVKGTLTPEKVLPIETQIAAAVEDVLVEEGQDVQKGDPLIRLYSQEIMDQKIEAETELDEARKALAQLVVDQELELEAERLKILDAENEVAAEEKNVELQKLLYDYGSIARMELEKAERALEAAKRKLGQTRRELELTIRKHDTERVTAEKAAAAAEAKLNTILEKIDQFVVSAPITGRVLSLKIPVNRAVTAHQELGEIADLTKQVVELEVGPGQTERFAVGTPVEITLGQTRYAGEVAYIAPQARQGTDGPTVLVRVEFQDEVSHLRPYSSVTADIHLEMHPDSLYLPRGAYLTSGQQLFVYVIEGDRAVKRDVQFGLLEGNYVQILRGLELGDYVIVSSYDAYRHLDEIQILPEGGRAL